MGLRDAFRSRKEADDDGPADTPLGAAAGDPISFTPRSDGRYQGVDEPGRNPTSGAVRGWLRFAGARAFWAPGDTPSAELSTALGPGASVWTGEYTRAGRFTVARRFERPTVFTVLEVTEDGFLARVTAPTPGESGLIRYTFVPAGPAL